jgi:hypothetical protein
VASSLRPLIQALARMMDPAVGGYSQFQLCCRRVMAAARGNDPAELTAGVELLAPLLSQVRGAYSQVALVAGTLVEWGGSPLPLRDVLPRRAAASMEMSELFPGVWATVAGRRPLPDRQDLSAIASTRDRLVTHAGRCGLPTGQAALIAWSWFDVTDWARALIAAMADREFRAAMANRDRIRDAALAMEGQLETVDCLLGLTLVLDDEPLVILDDQLGRGFHLTMSGVGDNFQLHTLLADRLAGQVPGLEPPRPAWVAAATDGELRRPADDPIYRRFRLFDGHGAYVYPEGRPADIQPLDGTRVLVLHPPLAPFAWTGGRFYPRMPPALTLDRLLEPAEAGDWLDRIAPAVETDLMAHGRVPPSPRPSGASGHR